MDNEKFQNRYRISRLRTFSCSLNRTPKTVNKIRNM